MRAYNWIIYLCLFVILFSLVGCTSTNNMPSTKPKDFKFVFSYGVGGYNQLDTIEGKYTKDMVTDPSVTIDLKLSDEEMNAIYLEMMKIDILSYPTNFNPRGNIIQTPFSTYDIKVIIDGKEKNISWKDRKASKSKEAVQLRELFRKIQEIIVNREEFKKLPSAKGGYA